MADDPRIGYVGADSGELTFPELTLSGQEYSQPLAIKMLSGGRFVVLDQDTPPGFDVAAELAKLDAPAPKASRKAASSES